MVRHYLPVAALSSLLFLVVAATNAAATFSFVVSLSTAYISMLLFVFTLVCGSINILRNRPNPVSTDVRRDAGIMAALFAFIHIWAGLQNHFRGQWQAYFIDPLDGGFVPRSDPFGVANYLGLAATAIVVLLFAISNDFALRQLGRRPWKNLQRLNYGGFALIVIHALLFTVITNRERLYVMALITCIVFTLTLQVAGVVTMRTRKRAKSSG